MQDDTGSINHRTQGRARQGMGFGADSRNQLLSRGAGTTTSQRQALLLETAAHQVNYKLAWAALLKVAEPRFREQFIHTGQAPKSAVHLA